MQLTEDKFDQAVSIVSSEIKNILLSLDKKEKEATFEIRLRSGKALVLIGRYGSAFLDRDKGLSFMLSPGAVFCSTEQINDIFARLCKYSVYTHIESIIKGYITYQGGHRAGISGTASVDSRGVITSVNDISSINIRIARQIKGSADEIISQLFAEKICNVIIAGAVSSGKTTVLRDIVRQLSDKLYKVSLIDERREIASVNGSIAQNDVGINTDIFTSYPKKDGIMNALKTMSPEIIALDEVGEDEELEGIRLGLNSGVHFIVTVHASNYQELLLRPQIAKLLSYKAFDKIILLKSADNPSVVADIFDAHKIYDEICGNNSSSDKYYSYRGENIIVT